MATVTFERVTKRYRPDVTAVDDLDLQVEEGELLILVGPSGCGKTTTLRCVAGLEAIDQGVVRIGDRVINNVAPKDRNVAMVFQSYALYPHMSVRGNLSFGLEALRTSKAEVERRVRQTAGILDLEPLLDRKPHALSDGQRQRVALGRAIVREPAVFLMDEPLSNLDANLRVQMRAEILRLQRQLGVTTIYVTHDQVEAMTMGERIAVMSDGVLQQVGTPHELYDSPVNVFVAAFIGSPAMNFAAASTSDRTLQFASATLRLGDTKIMSHGGNEVLIGFRPEDLEVGAGPGSAAMTIQARVEVVEYLGREDLIHADVEGHKIMALVPAFRRLRIGDAVEFTIPGRKLHVFDPETKQRLLGVT
jgi:multiple sugar transport system ATP-binding protein